VFFCPARLQRTSTLAFALVLGLTAGIGLAFLLENMDNTVRTTEQAQIISGVPALGMIPMGSKNGLDGAGKTQFRTFYTDLFVTDAHNDYLQHLAETGLLGFAVILWFLVTLYRNAWRKLKDWPNDITGAVAFACLLGCTGILVHSFVDFNLQIPANAAWFYVLCFLAASPHAIEYHHRMRRSRRTQTQEQEADPGEPLSADS